MAGATPPAANAAGYVLRGDAGKSCPSPSRRAMRLSLGLGTLGNRSGSGFRALAGALLMIRQPRIDLGRGLRVGEELLARLERWLGLAAREAPDRKRRESECQHEGVHEERTRSRDLHDDRAHGRADRTAERPHEQ